MSPSQDRCDYKLCTCETAPVVKNARRFCSDLCADAANLVTRETSLCPCLHQGCKGNGGKPIPPEERSEVGTAQR